MPIPIIYSDRFLDHETGSFHPEKPGRLTAIVEHLRHSDLAAQIEWRSPNPVSSRNIFKQLQRFHTQAYIDRVAALAAAGGGQSDADTVISAASFEVALLAVSAWLDGVDIVLESNAPVFVAARPPGHHALAHTSMGFCIFANAAIAALYALDQPRIERVAILDWDVHHGNGTQAAIWDHPQIRYVSLHQAPFYPGTGWQDETGSYDNIRNFPLQANATIKEYLPVFEQEVIPYLQNFQPDLLIISAGFDANRADPLASMALLPPDYGRLTSLCLQHFGGKILLGLEGGYDFDSLAASVSAVIRACLDCAS